MKKFIITLVTTLLIFLAPTVLADNFEVGAKHAIAVDVATGKILYEKDANQPVEIASITKLLTAYLVYEAIHQGKFTLQTSVDISDYPYQLTVNPDASNVPLEARKYTVEELLETSLIASANSSAIALAEKVTAVASEKLTIVRRYNHKKPTVHFTTDKNGYPTPLKKGVVVGKLTYTDNDLIGKGYLDKKPPTISMLSAEKIGRPFFLKSWWNEFVQYVNEKL